MPDRWDKFAADASAAIAAGESEAAVSQILEMLAHGMRQIERAAEAIEKLAQQGERA